MEGMMDIDKNNVDLSQLFKWTSDVVIRDAASTEITTVYMRLVGDEKINRARVFALRESAKLRKSLRTPGTDEYEAFMAEALANTKKDLTVAIGLLNLGTLMREARNDVSVPFPVPPSADASLEEQEKYQAEIDVYPEIYNEKVSERLQEILKREAVELKKLSKAELKEEYEITMISYVCEQHMLRNFQDRCIYFGTFKDEARTQLAFSSWDEYNDSALMVKEQLRDAYAELEMGTEDLKKLPEATLSTLRGIL